MKIRVIRGRIDFGEQLPPICYSKMKLSNRYCFAAYQSQVEPTLKANYATHDFSQASDLGYQTSASAVFSANIEGNSLDLNSFMNLQLARRKFKPTKEVIEIENLITAYQFAQRHPLNEMNLLKSHQLLAKTLLVSRQRGKYRRNRAGVFSPSGLVYLAVEPELVAAEMGALFAEIAQLLNSTLTLTEIFYFASLIHLRFVHIHPFVDGNGRAARLAEKWFLAHHLGENGWRVPAERHYKTHQADYYQALNLGVNFYELDDEQCLPFLLMLPGCLEK